MLKENILSIRDESGTGSVYHELKLSFDKVSVSVRDIIEQRVQHEVELYNAKARQYVHALVTPTEIEERLNGKKPRKPVDLEKQIHIAFDAFDTNGFFILVDDMQVESLDDMVTISPETTVSFIRLTPLVGG